MNDPCWRGAAFGDDGTYGWLIGESMSNIETLAVNIFADGADFEEFGKLRANPIVKGFTTNPTLMRLAGIEDYEAFARDVIPLVDGLPISFEVFADEFDEMEAQARYIASWGSNVFVKIPITNTRGESSVDLVQRLAGDGVQVNVTAIFTLSQVEGIAAVLSPDVSANVSIFAGRIADTGVDPIEIVRSGVEMVADKPLTKVIWASPRELLNIFHADACGCHIITVTSDLLKKLPSVGKDLEGFSLETVKMFREDAVGAGFSIDCGQ